MKKHCFGAHTIKTMLFLEQFLFFKIILMKKFLFYLFANFLVVAFCNWLLLQIVYPLWAGYWLQIGLPVSLILLSLLYPLLNSIKLWYERHLWMYATMVVILFVYWFLATLLLEKQTVFWSFKTAMEGCTFGQIFGMWLAYLILLVMNYRLGKYFFKENQLLREQYEY